MPQRSAQRESARKIEVVMAAEADTFSWARVLIACGVVGGMLAALGGGLAYLSKRGMALPITCSGFRKVCARRRLAVVETLPLDIKRRLVIVRCDDREHLLLLGVNQDMLVSSNIDSRPAEPEIPLPRSDE